MHRRLLERPSLNFANASIMIRMEGCVYRRDRIDVRAFLLDLMTGLASGAAFRKVIVDAMTAQNRAIDLHAI